jgi:hypothetical protein
MAWIESHQSLRGHPKTSKAARLCDTTPQALIGHIHCLWWWALDYAQDGDVTGYSPDELAEAAWWEGDPQLFVDALLKCGVRDKPGFLEVTPDGRTLIHDWWDYAGKLIQRREDNAKRMRDKRAEHVQDTCETRAPATVPNRTKPTKPNSTVPTNGDSDDASASLPPEIKQDLDSCLRLFGAKRFKTPAQRTAYIEIYNKHGPEIFRRAVTWGAQSGMGLGDVKRMASAANTMALNADKPREGNNGAAYRRQSQQDNPDEAALLAKYAKFDE